MKKVLILAGCMLCNTLYAAIPGSLDTTFGFGAGYVATQLGITGMVYASTACALQADGKIVVVGGALGQSGIMQCTIRRYLQTGALDTTFGANKTGIVMVPVGTSQSLLGAVAAQPDGKIVAGGISQNKNEAHRVILVRFNYDGTLDETFGVGGVVITWLNDQNISATSLALQPDGKILGAGTALIGGQQRLFIVRGTSQGVLDTTFNPTGTGSGKPGYVVAPWAQMASAQDLIVQADGSIVAAAAFYLSANDVAPAVVRYTKQGRLDTSFGALHGYSVVPITGASSIPYRLLQQTDGQLVVIGSGEGITTDDLLFVTRLSEDGVLDTAFANKGAFSLLLAEGTGQYSGRGVMQSDGKIVVCGYTGSMGSIRSVLLRLKTDGALDTTFGANRTGVVYTQLMAGHDMMSIDCLWQPDGKIDVVGVLNEGDPYQPFSSAMRGLAMRFVGYATSVPEDQATAAQNACGCLGLSINDVNTSTAFFQTLRSKYYDLLRPIAAGVRC